jgi:hypothetical protein
MPYILEVQKFNINGHIDFPAYTGKCEHIGYMNKLFKSKKEAAEYYDKYNPHMRKLNAIENWCSDWDPSSCLMYIVREHFYEYLKLPSFQDNK